MFAPEEKLKAISLVRDEKTSIRKAARIVGASYESVRRWLACHDETFQGIYNLFVCPSERTESHLMKLEDLPDNPEELKRIIFDLQFEKDLTEAVIDVVKKDPGVDPRMLPNRDKTVVIDAITKKTTRYSTNFLISSLNLAPASFYYHKKRLGKDPDADIRHKVIAACKAHRAWGYRRIKKTLDAEEETGSPSEKRVRRVMNQEGLQPSRRRKNSRYSSYSERADTSTLPNIPLQKDNTHNFFADKPNELWVTDVTEFLLPSGERVYLSAILDCFDGSLPAWRASVSEKADNLTNPTLSDACKTLTPEKRVVTHSDRGGQYHSVGWVKICKENNIVRSMSRKGHSPDNARMEGFFGRLKMEFFDMNDWADTSADKFIEELDAWLVYYNEKRPKSSLGWMPPMQYRANWLAAA